MRPSLLRTLVFVLAVAWLAVGCARRSPGPAPVVAGTGRAPDAPTPAAAARDLADVMASELKLTPAQTAQVRQILAGTVTAVNAARQQFPPKSAPLAAALQRINADSEKQLRQALGAATYQAFQRRKRQIQAQLQRRQR